MKTKDKVKKSGSWVALPFAPFSRARLLVIPAKAGIQYFPAPEGMNVRLQLCDI